LTQIMGRRAHVRDAGRRGRARGIFRRAEARPDSNSRRSSNVRAHSHRGGRQRDVAAGLGRGPGEAGKRILAEAAATAGKAGLPADTRLVEIETLQGRVADVIVQEARAWQAALIVVGTHGRRGLSHLFLGSVAEGVVRIAPVPVLLIRAT
jgi:nucleotide-binding universal stress UspA family protein